MRLNSACLLLISTAVLLTGCVTEPAPPEQRVYGSVTTPKKKKKEKGEVAPVVTEPEVKTEVVQPFDNR